MPDDPLNTQQRIGGRRILADALKTFMFSLSQGMAASSQAPGRRGSQLGMAAALGAPMQLQQMDEQRRVQDEDRRMRIEQVRELTRRGQLQDAVSVLNTLHDKQVAPEMKVNAPVATPAPIGTLGGGTFQPPTQFGGTQQVPLPLKPVEIPGYGPVIPRSAQQAAIARAEELRQQAQIEQEFAPPPPPRNIDPNSPEGIAAAVERERQLQSVRPQATPETEWILRNGQPLQIPKGTAQPGDRPYAPPEKPAPPPDDASSQYSIDSVNRTIAAISEVLPKITSTTAGPVGAIARRIPGTEAANVSAELATVAANIAFNALQQMRAASKTGGALGAISERELDLLSSVEGSLRQDQSPANLKAQLEKVRASMERWLVVARAQGGDKPKSDPLGLF